MCRPHSVKLLPTADTPLVCLLSSCVFRLLLPRDQLLVRYYILPQETHLGRQQHHAARELFLGTQVRVHVLDTRVYVCMCVQQPSLPSFAVPTWMHSTLRPPPLSPIQLTPFNTSNTTNRRSSLSQRLQWLAAATCTRPQASRTPQSPRAMMCTCASMSMMRRGSASASDATEMRVRRRQMVAVAATAR